MDSTKPSKTNWYVVTGAPSSGKTTMVNLLQERGYKTAIEHARHYIDLQRVEGKTVEEIRASQSEFQGKVLSMQIAQERKLPSEKIVFLDRAIPDTLAYQRFLELPLTEPLRAAAQGASYKKVFILDPLPLVHDYARTEDERAQLELHRLLTDVYESLKIPVVHVPVLPPSERADFILNHL